MGMRVECPECSKEISIDEAFAGGVCRCPYCKALAIVPAAPSGARPDAPEAESRPDAPQIRRASAEEAAALEARQAVIPTASPVRAQGILTIVLLSALLLMVAGGAWMVWGYGKAGKDTTGPPSTLPAAAPNPFVAGTSGPALADVKLQPPVAYVIDAGAAMEPTYDMAVGMVRVSIRSLSGDAAFNVVRCRNTGPEVMAAAAAPGGELGERQAKAFLGTDAVPEGVSDVAAALAKALELKPKTIVLLVRKPLDATEDVETAAREQGVTIDTIALDGDQFAQEILANLAEATGGQTRAYSMSDLEAALSKAPPIR